MGRLKGIAQEPREQQRHLADARGSLIPAWLSAWFGMWGSRRLRRTAMRNKLRGVPNTDVLSAFIGPYCRQLPVNRIVSANPLTLDDTLNVIGIGEKADRIANGKRGLRRRHDR